MVRSRILASSLHADHSRPGLRIGVTTVGRGHQGEHAADGGAGHHPLSAEPAVLAVDRGLKADDRIGTRKLGEPSEGRVEWLVGDDESLDMSVQTVAVRGWAERNLCGESVCCSYEHEASPHGLLDTGSDRRFPCLCGC